MRPPEIANSGENGGGGNRTRVTCQADTWSEQDFSSALAHDLDAFKVGCSLVAAVAWSEFMRHVNPRNTARDYGHPQTPEEQFVVDILTLKTEELADRWFAGSAVGYFAAVEKDIQRQLEDAAA